LPRCLRSPSTPLVLGPRGLQVAHRGGAGPPEPLTLTALAQVVAEPRVAAQRIVTRHPTVWDVLTSQGKHLQALLVARVILHLLRHMACVAPLLIPCPLQGQGQPEVEHGVLVARDVPHVHPFLG